MLRNWAQEMPIFTYELVHLFVIYKQPSEIPTYPECIHMFMLLFVEK